MSKFNKIFEAREEGKDRQSENEPLEKKKNSNRTIKNSSTRKKENASEKTTLPVLDKTDSQGKRTIEPVKQRGRPTAKRSDPNYLGFTTYIRRDTHLKAKIALLQEGKNRELSELVESLLVEWLNKID